MADDTRLGYPATTPDASTPAKPPTKPKRSPAYLIEDILPSRTAHIVTGPSGAGKTSWKLQLLADMRPAEDGSTGSFLGMQISYVPHLYVTFEMSQEQISHRVQQLALDIDRYLALPRSSIEGLGSADRVEEVLGRAEGAKLLVVEPLDALLRGSALSRHEVSDFMANLQWKCEQRDVTILGSMPSPKQRVESDYRHYRDMIYGSVSWSTGAGTVFVIFEDSFVICPREAAERRYRFSIEQGLGRAEVWESGSKSNVSDIYSRLDGYLESLGTGEVFSRDDVKSAKVFPSEASFDRWAADRRKEGEIERVRHGFYRRCRSRRPSRKPPRK